jgi:hypothetical protein
MITTRRMTMRYAIWLMLVIPLMPRRLLGADTGGIPYSKLDNYNAYINAENVRVREAPSTNARVPGFLKIGTFVQCLRVTNDDCRVGGMADRWYYITDIGSG